MININKKIINKVKGMIEQCWHDLPDEESTDKFVIKLIKTIQRDFWKFLKEDLEVAILNLMKG